MGSSRLLRLTGKMPYYGWVLMVVLGLTTIISYGTTQYLFGVLVVRVPHTPLVASLRPSTDLNSMNFLAFHLLRADDLAKPEDEDTRRVRVRQNGGVPRVLLIEMGQLKQIRLVVGIHAVIVDRRG